MENYSDISIDNFEIINILACDAIFCNNWKIFCRTLQFGASDLYQLEKIQAQSSIMGLILEVLKHWKSISVTANPETLSKRLRDIGCINSADAVERLCSRRENRIWFNIRSPTIFYVGRESELEMLKHQWKLCMEMKMMLFVAVTGLGGIGKSELSKNFARIFYEKFSGHCIWIDAETNQTLFQTLQYLAKNDLNLSLIDQSGKEKGLITLVKEIYDQISNKKCLIILDHMESYDHPIFNLLSDLASKRPPTHLKPFVIITSRFRAAKRYFGEKCIQLDLSILSKDSAVTFFNKSLNLNDYLRSNSILIQKLCTRLGCYPLAMQQAASYINQSVPNDTDKAALETGIQNYLDKIETEAKKLLDHKLPQYSAFDDVGKTTYLTWRITLDKIKQTSEIGNAALTIMDIISLFSPENISTQFLIQTLEGSEIVKESPEKYMLMDYFGRALKYKKLIRNISESYENCFHVLNDHSMINLFGNTISVHRLVQEVTRIKIKERGEMKCILDKLLKCIETMLKAETIPIEQMTHVRMIWEHAKNEELM